MALATRTRTAGILSFCLLLLSSFSATGALASAEPPQIAAHQSAAIVIGAGSCVGTNACYNAVGPIGDNSCIGEGACASTTGAIGDSSCIGLLQCQNAGTVGDNSCASGFQACLAATSVGDNSCNGSHDGCWGLPGIIGSNSCNGTNNFVCYQATVGDYSCNSNTEYKCTYATLGDCVNNDVTPGACFQPDARIRRVGKTNMVGNDIYNTDGTDQTLTNTLGDGAVRYVITIQNDGLVADSFTIGSSNGVTLIPLPPVNFYHAWQPVQDITAAVMAGTYTTPTIAPGGVYRIRAVVRPLQVNVNQLAEGVGLNFSWLVTATSVGNATEADAVQFSINVPIT